MENNKCIVLEGELENIISELSETGMFSQDDCKTVLQLLEENIDILSEDETFEKVLFNKVGAGYTTANYQYYINIKITTILILVYLLDYKFTHGAAAALSSIMGIKTGAIVKLQEENGEKCIFKELTLQKKQGDKNVLKKFKGECCNNHYQCCYRSEGKCNCSKEQIEIILNSFASKNIVVKKGRKYLVQF